MLRVILLLAAASTCPGYLSATEIYRCTGASGEPAFSQQPCGTATVVSSPASTAPATPVPGLRASERAWLAERERQRARGRPRKSRSVPAAKQTAKQAFRCRDKRRALEGVRAKLRHGYKPAQGDKLRRRRRAYEDYLATFCS